MVFTLNSYRFYRYRNKTEYTIGYDEENNMTIGFLLGSTRDGIVTVSNPDECINIPSQHKLIGKLFQQFITQGPHKPYDKISHTGLWRLLMVRTTETRDAMAVLQINPLAFTEDYTLETLKEGLKKFIEDNANETHQCM